MVDEAKEELRMRMRAVASEYAERGDAVGWFDEWYKRAAGDNSQIPWGDLEPNPILKKWAEKNGLKGEGRSALVVGCGLGDDAAYLDELGFSVTAFDISPTAIDWAKNVHSGKDINFVAADLFDPPAVWIGAFEFVLEIYTIQPLPIELRPKVIDQISSFVVDGGELLVVTRGREDGEESPQLPWPLSTKDLARFGENGFVQKNFAEYIDPEDEKRRFVIDYRRE